MGKTQTIDTEYTSIKKYLRYYRDIRANGIDGFEVAKIQSQVDTKTGFVLCSVVVTSKLTKRAQEAQDAQDAQEAAADQLEESNQ